MADEIGLVRLAIHGDEETAEELCDALQVAFDHSRRWACEPDDEAFGYELLVRRVMDNRPGSLDPRADEAGLLYGRRVNPTPSEDDYYDVVTEQPVPLLTKMEVDSRVISIDTETTGLSSRDDEVIQVGIVDAWSGKTLLSTYVRPERHMEWPEAMEVNGITPDMVADAPSQEEVANRVQELVDSAELCLAYNAPFDGPFLRRMGVSFAKTRLEDIMIPYARVYHEWDDYHCDYRWQKLGNAAAQVGYDWSGERAHGADADARAAAAVWRWMQEHCAF